jgi:hypothetical protein
MPFGGYMTAEQHAPGSNRTRTPLEPVSRSLEHNVAVLAVCECAPQRRTFGSTADRITSVTN